MFDVNPQGLDSNSGPLVLEVTALSIVSQPLPKAAFILYLDYSLQKITVLCRDVYGKIMQQTASSIIVP